MSSSSLSLEQLLRLHGITRDIASHSQKQLRSHLDALSPLFRPRRFLGDHTEGAGREPVAGSDRAWTELQELYTRVAVRPFDLRPELSNPLPSIPTQLALYDWEYMHGLETERGWQSIRVTSPLTWVLTYSSSYSPAVLRQQILDGQGQKDPDAVKAFVLRACLMYLLFQRVPALKELLSGLRYRVEIRTSRELGDLPLVTIAAPYETIRPSDVLVTKAAGFAGGSSFSEVIDVDSIRRLVDPIREDAARLLRQHGEEIRTA